ncbi:hypothetical protein CHISP_3138 [Chitinispirillum alkaliphilum]|nr:hypothetical protein CHISP_3138 [Chitinispirillum alkaliphilum]
MSNLSNSTIALLNLTDIFKQSAVNCVEAFFGISCQETQDWAVVEQLCEQSDLTLIVGSASEEYQAILAIGINQDAIESFVGEKVDFNEARDIFGEFANVYSGMLMDEADFNSIFGYLNQSVPVLYSEGTPFLPFVSGVQGKVLVDDGKWMYIGFAIKKATKK